MQPVGWVIVEVLVAGSVVTPDPEGLDPYLSPPASPGVSPPHREYEEPVMTSARATRSTEMPHDGGFMSSPQAAVE